MSRWPPADLPGLHVDFGEWNHRAGRWLHFPAADYRCGRCPFADSASGDAVRGFVATIPKIHRAQCPNNQKGTT